MKEKEKLKLSINTSSKDKTIVKLDGQELVEDSRIQHSQVVLSMVMKLLKENKKELADLTEIEVFEGPGSFTGLRVGAAIANALGYALKIPVNGKKPWELEIVEPIYE